MDGAALILRFRNNVNGADGAREHRALIQQFGTALWGWWKREDEEAREVVLRNLSPSFRVKLVSPSEQLQFSARVRQIIFGKPTDTDRVPVYYRDRVSSIHTWFELDEITEENIQTEFVEVMGRVTRTLFTYQDFVHFLSNRRPIREIICNQTNLIHLSDVHLGEDHNFAFSGAPVGTNPEFGQVSKRISLVEAIASDLKRIDVSEIAAVVVSGDLVSRCKWDHHRVLQFFEELSRRLGVKKDAILFVPGNHDFYRQTEKPEDLNALDYGHEMSYRGLWSQFNGIPPLEEINRVVRLRFTQLRFDLTLGLLNSARWSSVPGFFEYGFVGKEKYKSVMEDISLPAERPSVRALVMHHHLVPIQPFEKTGLSSPRPVSVTLDAAEITADAQATGISLVLHGHQHRPDVVKISRFRESSENERSLTDEDIFICASGSCGSKEIPPHQWNSYSLLQFNEKSIVCRIRRLDPEDNCAGDIMKVVLPLRAL